MSQKNKIDQFENRTIFNYHLRSSSTPKPNMMRPGPKTIVGNKIEDDNKALQAENEKLKQSNKTLRNEVKKLKSQLQQECDDQINRLKMQLEEQKKRCAQVEFEKQKMADSMKLFKRNLKDEFERSVMPLLEDVETKIWNKIHQLNHKFEKLKSQTEESIKQFDKRRGDKAELDRRQAERRTLDLMKQMQDKVESSVMSLLETNISKMKTMLLSKSDQHTKQIEELKDKTGELLKQIDWPKERYIKVQNARRLHNKLLSVKMLFEEQSANLEKESIARMDRCFTKIQSVQSVTLYATGVLKKRNEKKLEEEEESYKYTNAFTSAGEGSVLDISKRYRHLQHNMRASAVRASKKVYRMPAKNFFCLQTMNAYEAAKTVLLEESGKCIHMHLIKLQPNDESFDEKMLKACMRIVNYVANDEVTNSAIKRITEALKSRDTEERSEAAKDDSLHDDVDKYYDTLAQLTWQAISRPIPMVYEMEEQVYKKDYHDLRDGESDDAGKPVVYVYPVLYSSNQWPRQIAQIGRVELKE